MWRIASLSIKKQHHVMLVANIVMTRPTSNLHDNVVLVRQHGVEMAYQYMFIVLVYYKCGSSRGTQYPVPVLYKFEYTYRNASYTASRVHGQVAGNCIFKWY